MNNSYKVFCVKSCYGCEALEGGRDLDEQAHPTPFAEARGWGGERQSGRDVWGKG